MTFKRKLSKIKDAKEYVPDLDESKENEPIVVADKLVQDVECDLVCFVQQTLNQYLWLQQLRKDIGILHQKQKTCSLKLKETLDYVEQTKKTAANLEKKRALRGKLYNLYKHNLGLEIKPLKGGPHEEQSEIRFSFRHVNKNKPEEEYTFILVLTGKKYDVKLCTPPIKEIHKLLVELNKTNDLSDFVIQVRRNFCTAATI